MRIALVSADPAGPHHGVRRPAAQVADHVERLARHLAAAGHDVALLLRREREDEPETLPNPAGYLCVRLAAGPGRPTASPDPSAAAAALGVAVGRWLERHPADVVHAHALPAALAVHAAVDAAQGEDHLRAGQAPVVVSLHASAGHQGLGAPADVLRRLAAGAAAVGAGSAAESDLLIAGGVPRRSIRVLPSGVDTSIYRRLPTQPGPGLRLLAPGPAARAGLGVLLHALRLVPRATLTVTADMSSPEDRGTVSRLSEAVRRWRLADRVRALDPATQADADPARLLQEADVVTFLRPDDPTATDALRAMACGRAVLATAVGALADAVVPGITGILVPPGHPMAVVSHLRHLASDLFAREAYGIAGADRALTRYGWDRVAGEHARLYAEVARVALPESDPFPLASLD